MSETSYIFGRNPVIEALASGKAIEKIFICYGTHGDSMSRIFSLAKKEKIPVVTQDKRKFSDLESKVLPSGAKSQGLIALLRKFDLYSIRELVKKSYENNDKPVLIVLDEISDPQNLGAIARSAECSGASGIIITEKNSSPITPLAIKASAGALEYLPVAKVTSLPQLMEELKQDGFWIVGTDSEADKIYSDSIYDSPIAIVIGSEGSGLRPSTKKHCDLLIKIPLSGKITSLNASVAAGVIMFEITRQRALL